MMLFDILKIQDLKNGIDAQLPEVLIHTEAIGLNLKSTIK